MRRIVLISACLLATPAFAQRIPDLSLSPEETMRQSNSPSHTIVQPSPYSTNAGPGDANDDNGNTPDNSKAATFMQGYCDQNFKPAVGISGALQACLTNGRKQACDRFRSLPQDAARAIDRSIGCAYAASESPDEPADPHCDHADTRRLDLIKRYWSDQNTAYTLVFLPDMVLNASNYCTGK